MTNTIQQSVADLRRRINITKTSKADTKVEELIKMISDKLAITNSLKSAIVYKHHELTDAQFASVVKFFIKDDVLIERKVETWTETDYMDRDTTEYSYQIQINVLEDL